MLNQTRFETVGGGTRKTILVDPNNSTALSCVVSSTGVTAGDDGKKWIKAGTPVTGDLTARNTPFTVSTTSPVGVILHDVEVTSGQANSQVVIFGTIDISKLDESVKTMLTSDVKESFKMIQFCS